MTPDRFIAAAFRDELLVLAQAWQNEASGTWGESDDHAALQRCCNELRAKLSSAELARESVGDGELLPCPFCGGEAQPCGPTAKPSDPKEHGGRFFPVVRCNKCWAEVMGKDHDESCKSAITAWNTRAREVDGGEKGVGEPRAWLYEFEYDEADGTDHALSLTPFLDTWVRAKNAKVVPLYASRSVGGDVFTADEMDTMRQWFDSVQDCNGGYLVPRDYVLAAEIYKRCGMRVPDSITALAGVSEGKNP